MSVYVSQCALICHTVRHVCYLDMMAADFLKGLFTITPSIRGFVVVITLPASGPRIIITGPHFVTTPHHLFLDLFSLPLIVQAHINTEVEGTGFLNIYQILYLSFCQS